MASINRPITESPYIHSGTAKPLEATNIVATPLVALHAIAQIHEEPAMHSGVNSSSGDMFADMFSDFTNDAVASVKSTTIEQARTETKQETESSASTYTFQATHIETSVKTLSVKNQNEKTTLETLDALFADKNALLTSGKFLSMDKGTYRLLPINEKTIRERSDDPFESQIALSLGNRLFIDPSLGLRPGQRIQVIDENGHASDLIIEHLTEEQVRMLKETMGAHFEALLPVLPQPKEDDNAVKEEQKGPTEGARQQLTVGDTKKKEEKEKPQQTFAPGVLPRILSDRNKEKEAKAEKDAELKDLKAFERKKDVEKQEITKSELKRTRTEKEAANEETVFTMPAPRHDAMGHKLSPIREKMKERGSKRKHAN